MKTEKIEADVLCVGGGIAGLMAAIRARELGATVVVVEKANTLRSGAGGGGCDHFVSYIPEVHGPDIEPLVKNRPPEHVKGGVPEHWWRTQLEKSPDIVKLWDSWGIPMKHNGKYYFAGNVLPGQIAPTWSLKYAGQNQKPILTREALKSGAEIMNRVMVFDLLRDGDAVIGAIGVHAREDKMIEFHAKSVIVGTGVNKMLYPSSTPTWMSNRSEPPSLTGDGKAMAFRAGAELSNMHMVAGMGSGPKYFPRQGKRSWIAVVRDSEGNPIGPFVTKPDKRYGDPTVYRYASLFEDVAKTGKGPVYMSCKGISDEDLKDQTYWLVHEGNTATLNHLEEEGIDLKKNDVEFGTYELQVGGRTKTNVKGETSVKGLYSPFMGGLSGAAISGWISGENAARYALEGASGTDFSKTESEIEKLSISLDRILSRETGTNWKEVMSALQQTMQDYAGSVRSEPSLKAGLSHLRRLREKAHSTIKAANQHELIHCLEAFNLLDIGELVFISAIERKETRGSHVRTDYPFTNPLMDKPLICKKVGDKPVTEWAEIDGGRS